MLSCACANPEWCKFTMEYLKAIVSHMEKCYGDRAKAYLLACGITDEWMDYDIVTPAVLKALAAFVGVNIDCEQEISVYANSRLLALHTAEGGDIKVTLPRECRQIWKLYSGAMVAENTREFVFRFDRPDTRLFDLASSKDS